jgi:hypothetical protein
MAEEEGQFEESVWGTVIMSPQHNFSVGRYKKKSSKNRTNATYPKPREQRRSTRRVQSAEDKGEAGC